MSKLTKIILGIVVVALVGILGYALGARQNATETTTTSAISTAVKTTTPTTAPVGSLTTTSTTAVDATADWKTYTNTNFNFFIRYPTDWSSKVLQEHSTGTLQVAFEPDTKNNSYIGKPGIILTAAKIGDASGTIDTNNCKQLNESVPKVKFGDETIIKTIMTCENGDYQVYYEEINKNKVSYAASGIQNGDDTAIKIFDQILSTIKFTQ